MRLHKPTLSTFGTLWEVFQEQQPVVRVVVLATTVRPAEWHFVHGCCTRGEQAGRENFNKADDIIKDTTGKLIRQRVRKREVIMM